MESTSPTLQVSSLYCCPCFPSNNCLFSLFQPITESTKKTSEKTTSDGRAITAIPPKTNTVHEVALSTLHQPPSKQIQKETSSTDPNLEKTWVLVEDCTTENDWTMVKEEKTE